MTTRGVAPFGPDEHPGTSQPTPGSPSSESSGNGSPGAPGRSRTPDEDDDDPVLAETEDHVDEPLRALGSLRQCRARVRHLNHQLQVAPLGAVDSWRAVPGGVGRGPLLGDLGLARGCGHDALLGNLTVRELGDEPSLPHDEGPVAHPQDLGKL